METLTVLCRIRPRDIAYLRGIVESYDGMAVVKTVDPREAVVELRVAPGCEEIVHELLHHLIRHEGLQLTPIGVSSPEFAVIRKSSIPRVSKKRR